MREGRELGVDAFASVAAFSHVSLPAASRDIHFAHFCEGRTGPSLHKMSCSLLSVRILCVKCHAPLDGASPFLQIYIYIHFYELVYTFDIWNGFVWGLCVFCVFFLGAIGKSGDAFF